MTNLMMSFRYYTKTKTSISGYMSICNSIRDMMIHNEPMPKNYHHLTTDIS